MKLRVLTVGDVVGRPGLDILVSMLPGLRRELNAHLVIVNGENAADGRGMLPEHAEAILRAGADVVTTGDHVDKRRELSHHLPSAKRILRAANHPPEATGLRHVVVATDVGVDVAVFSLVGRAFMDPADCPFRAADAMLGKVGASRRPVIVEMHAEATSEKTALGHHLDGRASVVFGTHTHVPTADGRVLPGGTGYVTDLGMTGPHQSVIGRRWEPVVRHFVRRSPEPWPVAEEDVRLQGALFTLDTVSRRCLQVERVDRSAESSARTTGVQS